MIEYFVPQGSSFAADIDNLILLVTVIVGFWFVVTVGMFFYLLVKYRAQPGQSAQYVTGKEPHLKKWITIPHMLIILCDIVLIVGAVSVWYHIKQYRPENPDREIRVISQQWAWTFQHPGPDGVLSPRDALDTGDDIILVDELHLEKDQTYVFHLESRDVLHSFSIPIFRLKQDALPGRVITGWFVPTLTGEYDIQCAEMCGIGHGIMRAQLIVEDAAQHAMWMHGVDKTRVASTPAGAPQSM